jgi:ankyrin repeat protein
MAIFRTFRFGLFALLLCAVAVLACLWPCVSPLASNQQGQSYPTFDYDIAQEHELQPHRRTIPLEGVLPGFNQLRVTLTVSADGEVVGADASGNPKVLEFWPQLEAEVRAWKFKPFEVDGKAVAAEVEEYIDLVPRERIPKNHVAAPDLLLDSEVTIMLERSGCFGSCPSYTVTVGTNGVVFEGGSYVVAHGRHTDTVDAEQVRELAKRFVSADFYSMDDSYLASVTDSPTYILSLSIDGHEKRVVDYVGSWEGMPAIVTELENEVDRFGQTQRWVKGDQGLVKTLEREAFNFHSFEALVILKEASRRGKARTVQELLKAGVPLDPHPSPRPKDPNTAALFDTVGWLNAASNHPDVLRVLMGAGASKNDQPDKDLALAASANAGNLEAAQMLIAYGANPNADLSQLTVTESAAGMIWETKGAESVLIYAAASGNPEMVREILRYHPEVDARDFRGRTAMFSAAEYRSRDADGARVECVRLLAQAGANVNARDNEGNTPLHETFLTDVEEELLKLGADVNARNRDGETPIFTTVDDDAIPLFIKHGADLTIRNKKGETVIEAAKERGPSRQEALRKAIQKSSDLEGKPTSPSRP